MCAYSKENYLIIIFLRAAPHKEKVCPSGMRVALEWGSAPTSAEGRVARKRSESESRVCSLQATRITRRHVVLREKLDVVKAREYWISKATLRPPPSAHFGTTHRATATILFLKSKNGFLQFQFHNLLSTMCELYNKFVRFFLPPLCCTSPALTWERVCFV